MTLCHVCVEHRNTLYKAFSVVCFLQSRSKGKSHEPCLRFSFS